MVATVAGLWTGARLLTDAVVRLARRVGLSELTIGLTVVAMGTSTPELVVTSDAAFRRLGDIAVGSVVGSNIYNLAFVLGVVSLVRVIPVERSLVNRDGIALLASALAGAGAMLDLTVSRIEGLALLGLPVGYTALLLRRGAGPEPSGTTDPGSGAGATRAPPDAGAEADREAVPVAAATDRAAFRPRDVALFAAGLVLILVSGDLMMGAASELDPRRRRLRLGDRGAIVAAGTSTPEFAVSLVATRRGSIGVSAGNVVGSNVFDVLGIMGLGAMLRPLSFGAVALESVAWLVAVSAAIVAALWTGRQLSRPEGGLLACSGLARWVLGLLGLVG